MNNRRLSFALLLGLAAVSVFASDWDQWRGPHRDGQIDGFKSPTQWPKKLDRTWRVEIGEGHASPLVIGNSIYTFSRQGENEVIRRLDIKDGHQVWKDSYVAPFELSPNAAKHGSGPKSTPVYRDGRLFTLGMDGALTGYEAKTGKILWRKQMKVAHKDPAPPAGNSMSPLVEGGLLIGHVGGYDDGAITAFDVKTGKVKWSWTGDGPSYGSPIVIVREGVRQIVSLSHKMCVGIDAKDGKLLWSMPFVTPYDQNAITPLEADGNIIFGGLQQPTVAYKVTKSGDKWKTEKVWETRDVTLHMSTGVASGGKLYGLSQRRSGQMFVLDASNGKTLWMDAGRVGEYAVFLDAGDALFALTPTADLVAYKKTGNTLTEAARYEVADSATWATPGVQGSNLLIKDVNTLALWRMPS